MVIFMKTLRHTFFVFFTIITFLLIIGLIFIYSASSVFALEKFGNPHYYVKKQIIALVIGLCGMFFFHSISLKFLKKNSPLLFISTLILTALTRVPGLGITINGSHRWLKCGPLIFQPSELLKIGFILYCAYLISRKEYALSSFFYSYLPFLCIIGLSSVVLLAQPDFGQTVTLGATALSMLFIARINSSYLLYTLLPLIPLLGVLIFLKPYRAQRIFTFLNPWQDPQGAGFQIIQSLIAIGSGNIWGIGIAQSKQKFFYLPMQHTDFIFSIIAEETGFIGSLILISLYIGFLYYGIKIAWYLKDVFATFTTLGFVILITLQALINLCVATGLMPTKGIGLPFISSGNSSLIAYLCMVGIISNCVRNNTPQGAL